MYLITFYHCTFLLLRLWSLCNLRKVPIHKFSIFNLPTTQRLQCAVCLSNGLLRPLYTTKLVADFSSFFFLLLTN